MNGAAAVAAAADSSLREKGPFYFSALTFPYVFFSLVKGAAVVGQ